MITFTTVTYKNFLSTGNAPTKIYLNKNTTTLVQGASGAGKSTMIDALCFGLFGKPFRNINKPQLVNSINQKQCEVTVEFSTSGKSYKIIRGIKPNKFEIYCDDKFLNQEAATKDYQRILEQQILQMSFKTFTQVVILGSTAYTPFMQLTAAARREIIEDILDIGIFSVMNTLLKQQIQESKDEQTVIDSEIKSRKSKAEVFSKMIKVLSDKQDEELEGIRNNIAALKEEVSDYETQYADLSSKFNDAMSKTKDFEKLSDARDKIYDKSRNKTITIASIEKNKNFFALSNECPTCDQHIHEDHKQQKIAELDSMIQQETKEKEELDSMYKKAVDKVKTLQDLLDSSADYSKQMSSIKASIDTLTTQIFRETKKLESAAVSSNELDNARKDLRSIVDEVQSMVNAKKELAELRELQENASMLLRDSGIKTAIIREYLPLMNKLLAKYLADMEMFVDFTFDENFNEVIRSRHRDEFTYGNFSEGEKLRIDLSILFMFRHIAKLKNSASTNLLILDEILVGRLDQSNTDIVINMVNEMANDGTNIIAIAHADSLADKFRGLIKFEKINGYSVMT